MSLNDKVISYLSVNNIAYMPSDYQTVESEGVESIAYWNTDKLGPKPTDEQLAAINSLPLLLLLPQFQSAAQSLLDTHAKSWGYDSIISAASYTNSTNTKFKAESLALIAWRDAVWEVVANITNATQTVDAFKALLPSAPARPNNT